jgi:tetratricopeptide (TPR) repeat protein
MSFQGERGNRFCFVAIVRDESPVIERCIASIAHLATSYLICDTGSVDDTAAKIEATMARLGIPGAVIHKEWMSYGENRTYLFEQVRRHPASRDCRYIVFHDADEVFITDRADPESYLDEKAAERLFHQLESRPEDIFLFTTLYAGISYPRWQVVRNNQDYRWEMPFQEYLVAAERSAAYHVDWIFNLARKQGNSARDPARDEKGIKMLERYLERNPDEPRALFYLAQTHRDLGQLEQAREVYARRARCASGYDQEKYLSLLYRARLEQGEAAKLASLWEAATFMPQRLEAVYELMMHYHSRGDHARAAALGGLAPEKPQRGMFAESAIYDYLFELNYSVSCVYAGLHEKAYEIGSRLASRRSYPPDLDTKVRNNLEYYASRLPLGTRVPTPRPTLLVIDDFYPDPDAVRRFALQQEFVVSGNYPGLRTKSFAGEDDKRKFESLFGRKVSYFPEQYNGSFQIVTRNERSWIHRDLTEYSCVVFLTPDPPANSGTVFYRHLPTGAQKAGWKEREDLLSADSRNEDQWEVIDRIGNKYNRAVFFDGFLSHRSDEYFGEDRTTGRLFQTFFFNLMP